MHNIIVNYERVRNVLKSYVYNSTVSSNFHKRISL